MNSVFLILIFLLAAVVIVPLFKRFGLGSVLGYLIAGVLIGPFVMNLIWDPENYKAVAEFGVIFLMFIIGLELAPKRLWVMRKPILSFGGLQVLGSTALLALAWWLFSGDLQQSLIVGFALSLSSTALVLQSLSERQELNSVQGRNTFSILLFQDLAVIPVLAVIPLLAVATIDAGAGTHVFDWKMSLATVVGVVIAGQFLVRPLLQWVAKTKQGEIFTALSLLLILGTAILFEHSGLSMALGSFLAGVLLAESEFKHEIEATIEPFKGLLLGLFFMTVGMNLDLSVLKTQPEVLLAGVLGLISIKLVVLVITGQILGLKNYGGLRLGLYLCSGGEFAFVIFALLAQLKLINAEVSNLLTAVVSVSLLLAPLIFKLDDKLRKALTKAQVDESKYDEIHDSNEVIVAGFGRYGQIICRVLMAKKIKFTALDKNIEQVDFVRKFGNKIYYGDASRLELLRSAKIENAKVFVLAIDSIEESVKTAEVVRTHFPHIKIFARARNRHHVFQLKKLGVHHIMRENFLSSLSTTTQVLTELGLTYSEAVDVVKKFELYDQNMLEQQYLIHTDEKMLMQTAQQSAKDLSLIFEEDSKVKLLGKAN